MNIKDIKVGETYNVRVKVHRMTPAGLVCYACDKDGHYLSEHPNLFNEAEVEAFSPVTPENGIKNTETAPKYDPCRLFRKGDKVRVVERDGRDYRDYDPYTNIQTPELYTILENEEDVIDGGCVGIRIGEGNVEYEIPFYFLELVTPFEELEPYNVKFLQACKIPDTYYYWAVMDNTGNEVARFWHEQYEKGQAEAAAEAECARLNAEHRKEKA